MQNLDVWDMVQRKERAILLSQRRAEHRRQVRDAIARRMRSTHSRAGLLQRAWDVATRRARSLREWETLLQRGAGHGQSNPEVMATAEHASSAHRP